jgi:hypothetical protein
MNFRFVGIIVKKEVSYSLVLSLLLSVNLSLPINENDDRKMALVYFGGPENYFPKFW